MSRRRIIAFCALLALAVVPVRARPQQFRASVDVVQLDVAVVSGKKPVTGLEAADFGVTDNGVKQQVISVTRETLPIDVTMVIDTSESLSESLVRSIVSGANRIRERLRPADRLSLMVFNQRIQERISLSTATAVKAIDLGATTGQTSLNDALAVVLANRPVPERRQMALVFTDGYDSSSFLDERDVMDLAGRSNTAVFIVAKAVDFGSSLTPGVTLSSVNIEGGKVMARTRQPVGFFRELAAATGGLAQIVSGFNTVPGSDNPGEIRANTNLLDDSFIAAFEDFRSSYVLRYNLEGVPRSGWHAVVVTVTKPGKTYLVRTRSGYVGG